MEARLFHIFRNTPLGRETLLQSIYFCRQMRAEPLIYIPRHTKFLMYFENDVVQVDLDVSYLTDAQTAQAHAEDLLAQGNLRGKFIEPKHFTASTLPDIGTDFDFMCCPRSISDLSSKIGLGYIGPRVRRIVQSARFPVLLTSPVYKPWTRVTVCFGGSANAFNALRLGLQVCRQTDLPITIFTQAESKDKSHYEAMIAREGLDEDLSHHDCRWHFFENGPLEENLYQVPHDSLVVLGAFGHGLIRDIVFGSKMEKIQSTLSNNLLIVGPQYSGVPA
jgi:hypothetical protein